MFVYMMSEEGKENELTVIVIVLYPGKTISTQLQEKWFLSLFAFSIFSVVLRLFVEHSQPDQDLR